MKIAVIGAGKIGSTLGKKWAIAGHAIRFGVRNPSDQKYADLHHIGDVQTIDEAINAADIVLVSLPGTAVMDFATEHGAALAGKIVIDSTNNMRNPVMNNLALLSNEAWGVHLVRAFNNLGWENFDNPTLESIRIDLFYCCDLDSRPVAEQLISEVGLRPVYTGDLSTAPIVDGLTRLWFALAMGQGYGRRIAFKMLEEE